MGLMEISVKLRASVGFDDVAGVWVSWCPALDVYSQDTSEKRARDNLQEAIMMFVEHCFKNNTLHAVLSARGFDAGQPGVGAGSDDDGDSIAIRPISVTQALSYEVTVPIPFFQRKGFVPVAATQ